MTDGTRGAAPAAVLFDLDGVLIDSYALWYPVVNAAAARFGAPPITEERLAEIFGQGVEDDARLLYPGRTPDEVREAYDAALPDHLDRVVVGPETIAALTELGRRGIRRAVVTNTQPSLARQLLKATGIAGHLEAWFAAGPEYREKPEPDLLEAALGRFGIPPARALMVGDTHYDAEAAAGAGVPFLLFELARDTGLGRALAPLLDGTDAP